jgi:uncharacterized protein (TIGR00255 family)
MIRSMTGFGQADRSLQGFKLQIDMKSVNHRYSEVMVRMPREWLKYEDMLKKAALQSIRRGRVDIFVTIDRVGTSDKQVELDWSLAEQYSRAADQLQEKLNLQGSLSISDLIRLPEVIYLKESLTESSEEFEAALLSCIQDAVKQLTHMRDLEGAELYKDLLKRIELLKRYIEQINDFAAIAGEEHRTKLTQRLQELLGDTKMDETRLTMEVALLAERSNIDEELTRLSSHRVQFIELLQSGEAVGRKMDFLIQEMNREINTIGSKSNHNEVIGLVVEMKAELEKVREQVQNIE